MRIHYDPSVDAAYILLAADDEAVRYAYTYACDPEEVGGQIHLKFDLMNRLVGIEVLQASKKLPPSLIKESSP